MKGERASFLGGLSVQLLALTIFPLTLLLLIIAFGSVSLHQRDMRALVGERDERAVQSAAAALASELHHRAASISNLAMLAGATDRIPTLATPAETASDFDGGIAYLAPGGKVIESNGPPELWSSIAGGGIQLASPSNPGPVLSKPVLHPGSERWFVIASRFVPSPSMVVAGAFSPAELARQVLSASYPSTENVTVYLVNEERQVIFTSGAPPGSTLPAGHPGLAEALAGHTGTTYVRRGALEHVVAYSPIPGAAWAIITEEDWREVASPSLQATQMAPLVLVPAFILALLALWFVARRIVQPLQELETRAAALAWGDFQAIKQPVGGIPEIRHLQLELGEMSRKVQAAQEGLRDYIGAITSAQEEERLRLARELHDDTIQSVIALKQRVQLAQKTVKDPASSRALSQLESLAEETIQGLRRMTRALRPIYLEDLGLVTALEMLARETGQNHGLQVEFHGEGAEERLAPEVELALYRVAQEALSNVVRHAHATHADLRLEFGEREIVLEVWDHGVGFQVPRVPTDFAPAGHFGLLGIRERADLIGGRLEVQSAPGQGTRLAVRLGRQPA